MADRVYRHTLSGLYAAVILSDTHVGPLCVIHLKGLLSNLPAQPSA